MRTAVPYVQRHTVTLVRYGKLTIFPVARPEAGYLAQRCHQASRAKTELSASSGSQAGPLQETFLK
jgi:hypothetical protein